MHPNPYLPTNARVQLDTLHEQEFALHVTFGEELRGRMVLVPYGLVREASTMFDRRIGILLHARLVHLGKHDFALEPF